jgi:nucleoid-associated protein YgaU
MAKRITKPARKTATTTGTTVKVSRPEEKTTESNSGLFEKIQYDLQNNQSYLNLILGGLIIVVLGVLVYNYFNKPTSDLGSSMETQNEQIQGDVAKESLPGEYTIKEGDTLFTIAQKYYDDGYKYTEIVKANQMANENQVEVGQKITIPKLDMPTTSMTPSASPEASMSPQSSASVAPSMAASASPAAMDQSMMDHNQVDPTEKGATGGSANATMWGDKITGTSYTVQAGDWLSKIAGRAYGDVMAYQKIAEANKITNPDTIEVGTVLQLPR